MPVLTEPPAPTEVTRIGSYGAPVSPPPAPGRRYRHIDMNLSPAGILRDAGKGVAATGRLFRAAVRHPWGKESVAWRVWATPLEIAGLAVAALSSAAFGYATWLQALLPSLGLALVALLLFAWLGRRCERHWPGA
jgi:hypothetical protein